MTHQVTQAEARKLWIAALRSGEFEQCKEVLCNGKAHCCLGVLCEVAIAHGVPIKRRMAINQECVVFDGIESYAPLSAQSWVGLREQEGRFDGNLLTHLNDTGMSFAEIADIIEAEPEGLFVQ